jgi:single-strand DNA-binding protein
MSINKVILVGNVGKDPEIRHLDSGVAVATFTLATSETYTAKNGDKVTSTEWHNIVLWRGLADVADSFTSKGVSVPDLMRTKKVRRNMSQKYTAM